MPNKLQRRLIAPLVIAVLGLLMVGVAHAQRSTGSAAHMLLRHVETHATTTTTTAASSSTTTTTTVATTTSTTAPPTTTTTAPPPPPLPAAPAAPEIPHGKGMWIWQPRYANDGDPASIVAQP